MSSDRVGCTIRSTKVLSVMLVYVLQFLTVLRKTSFFQFFG